MTIDFHVALVERNQPKVIRSNVVFPEPLEPINA